MMPLVVGILVWLALGFIGVRLWAWGDDEHYEAGTAWLRVAAIFLGAWAFIFSLVVFVLDAQYQRLDSREHGVEDRLTRLARRITGTR